MIIIQYGDQSDMSNTCAFNFRLVSNSIVFLSNERRNQMGRLSSYKDWIIATMEF